MQALIRFFLFFFMGAIFFISANESSLLHSSDINKIMAQIFSQHVDHKEISKVIIKNSFKNYIDQFDPEKNYLLEKEVSPYSNISEKELAKFEDYYKKGNYAPYQELNSLIQQSISRSRSYRSLIEQDSGGLLQEAHNLNSLKQDREFALTEQGLKERIRNHIVSFIHQEIRRYGKNAISQNMPQVLAAYERYMRSTEEQYNYRDESGQFLSKAEQENLFSLHVLKSLAKSLDAHTNFFDPTEAYDMKVRLEKGFQGIGIVFQQSPQGVLIGSIINGGPAAKSGQVEERDQVIEINGKSVKDVPFEKLMDQIRDEKAESITLLLSRKVKGDEADKLFTVSLKREAIVLNEDRVDVASENFGNGLIGKITLHSFYQNDQGITSEKDVQDAILRLNQEGNLRGLILDLRENSGGFLTQAVKVAGLFITNGVVVISKYSNGEEKIYRDMDNRAAFDGPLVILTSKATASAAEIVAQALQDYGVALIVGDEHTYGKGTIQSQTVTENANGGGTYFKVTIGKYYTVSGKTPQIHGVKADIVVPGPLSNSHIGEEYLEYAIHKEDSINPEFSDNLADIDTALKPWYLKYYLPSLQHREMIWKEVLPLLRRNSEYRLENNKNYQLFLKRLNGNDETSLNLANASDVEDEENALGATEKNFGPGDLQMIEAVNIIKDMVYLQSKMRHQEYMIGAKGFSFAQ